MYTLSHDYTNQFSKRFYQFHNVDIQFNLNFQLVSTKITSKTEFSTKNSVEFLRWLAIKALQVKLLAVHLIAIHVKVPHLYPGVRFTGNYIKYLIVCRPHYFSSTRNIEYETKYSGLQFFLVIYFSSMCFCCLFLIVDKDWNRLITTSGIEKMVGATKTRIFSTLTYV